MHYAQHYAITPEMFSFKNAHKLCVNTLVKIDMVTIKAYCLLYCN